MIVDKIDADKDGFVTEGELKSWIKHAQKKYIYDNVENQWQEFDLNQDGLISWDEYRYVTYGTYLGKGQGVSLVETMVLSQRNKWVKQWRKGRNYTYLRQFDAVLILLHFINFEFVYYLFFKIFFILVF